MTQRLSRASLARVSLATLAMAGCAAAMVASVWHLWPQAQANALAMRPLAQLRSWQAPRAKAPDMAQWLQTRAALARALAKAPRNGELQEAMAYLYLSAALRADHAPALQAPYLIQALKHLSVATQARPMVASAWASQALARHRLVLLQPGLAETELPALWDSLDRALAYGRREHGVQQTAGGVALARWSQLSPARRQAVVAMHAQATPKQQRVLQSMASGSGVNLPSSGSAEP